MLAIIFMSYPASLKCEKSADGISRRAISAARAILISLAFVNLRSKSGDRSLAFCLDESGGPGGRTVIPADCSFALVAELKFIGVYLRCLCLIVAGHYEPRRVKLLKKGYISVTFCFKWRWA